MTKIDNTRVLWQVQVRLSPKHKWKNKGRFETRDAARYEASRLRETHYGSSKHDTYYEWLPLLPGYGFGNTRVQRVVKGQ